MSVELGILASSQQQAAPLLLDAYPGAVAAYSFRKLRTAYTGPCCAIISNGVQTDIGFVNGVVDTNSIINNGNADARLVVWYDQSGNGNNMTRNASSAGFLKISNVIQTLNGKVTCNFFPSTGIENNNSINLKNTFSNFSFAAIGTNSDISTLFTKGTNDIIFVALQNSNQHGFGAENVTFIAVKNTKAPTANTLYTSYYDGLNGAFRTNGTIQATGTFSNATFVNNVKLLLAYNGTGNAYPSICESVFYQSTQLSNQTGIEANINSYYTIY